MSFFIRKSYNLVLYGWTIARACALYLSRIQWGAVEIIPYNLVGFLIRICKVARYLLLLYIVRVGCE